VLDVAAGNGNASLAAARRGADVIASDYVDTLLGLAQRRAEAEGLQITTEVADAENLPYGDDSFDTVLSTVGVMFAPNPERSAAELVRVTKPGGKIGLANWTPEGFIGQMFKIVGAHVPPPAGVPSPLLWGTDAALNEAFRKLLAGAAFLALARNRSFKDEDGELSLDTGAFVTALEYATQREAVLLGKPAPDFFQAALASIACDGKEAVMVGDDAEADVAGALAAGLGAALLVRTGKYRPGDESKAKPAPSDTVADLVAAARWIMERRA